MNISRTDVRRSRSSIPKLRFEDQELTSFGGLVVVQKLFGVLKLGERLGSCVRHMKRGGAYSSDRILLLLIVHVMLGWRRLRDVTYYQSDPLVRRVLGLDRLPDVSTISRALRAFDAKAVAKMRGLLRSLVLDRLLKINLKRITVDFDGSVLSTKSRGTEGTAVGYNRKSKGSRSYYPLFATVAQTGQILDVAHRAGNVHDSNGATEFMSACFRSFEEVGYRGVLEARIDGAHFSDATLSTMEEHGVEFSVSVPFLRFPNLKKIVEDRRRWSKIDDTWSCFELEWKPKKWPATVRCIVYRQRVAVPRKGPIQLELFEPIERDFEYKVVATNKTVKPATALAFHNGRGAQEGIFAESKSQLQLDYIPTRRLIPNQIWTISVALAHNLGRELQMLVRQPERGITLSRTCLWVFDRFSSLRHRIIQRAGRFTSPQRQLTLTVAGNDALRQEFEDVLDALGKAA